VGVSTYGFDVQATPQVRIFHRCRLSIPKPETTIPSQSGSAKHRVSLILVLLLAGWVGGCAESDDGAKKFASEKERTIEVDDPAEKTQLVAVASGLVDTSSSEHDLEVEGRIDGRTLRVDLAWSGSWRNPHNWDAAWVFAKARRGRGPWQPLHLAPPSASAAVVASRTAIPPTVKVGEDGVGAWVYRSETGPTGRNDWTVAFDVDATGVEGRGALQVKVYGLEMVYVPEGPFYVGDGASRSAFLDQTSGAPARITNRGLVLSVSKDRGFQTAKYSDAVLSTKGVFVQGSKGINPDGPEASARNDAFPTGYGAFYAMKYELTHGEYAAYLNTLTLKQQPARTLFLDVRNAVNEGRDNPEYYRREGGAIQRRDDGTFYSPNPKRACNFLTWTDLAGYMDWAGLRPMTELEFEKAARGDREPIPGEYAWGTDVFKEAGWVNDDADADDRYADGNAVANVLYYRGRPDRRGPVRAGVFGENKPPRRDSTGASYYGIMEMSGNVAEAVVTLSQRKGRQFRGSHGDGVVDVEDGGATNADWPALEREGGMMRGGAWPLPVGLLRVSDRRFNPVDFDTRGYGDGARGARTAPRSTGSTSPSMDASEKRP